MSCLTWTSRLIFYERPVGNQSLQSVIFKQKSSNRKISVNNHPLIRCARSFDRAPRRKLASLFRHVISFDSSYGKLPPSRASLQARIMKPNALANGLLTLCVLARERRIVAFAKAHTEQYSRLTLLFISFLFYEYEIHQLSCTRMWECHPRRR